MKNQQPAAAQRRNAVRIKRQKQRRRRKMIRRLLTVLLIAAAISGIVALGFIAKDLIFKEPVQAYNISKEFTGSQVSASEGKAKLFASDLLSLIHI